ncbi:MAG: DUF1934 domain-containing protein [Clostridia bacterium]|nr:DUF1934 domain-containing protein [Clostridia bacterium]
MSERCEEVRIRIKSVRYEVEASLFSEESDDLFRRMGDGQTPEPEVIEINSVGALEQKDGRIELSYDETEVTGMEGSRTAVSFSENASGVVSMIREGMVSTVLIFEEGKRHHCVYNTPIMPFEVCVHTLKVDNRLCEDGILLLDYIVEIRGAQAERTKFQMEILR